MSENKESNLEIINYIIAKKKEIIDRLQFLRFKSPTVKEGISIEKGITRLLADMRKDLRVRAKIERDERSECDK